MVERPRRWRERRRILRGEIWLADLDPVVGHEQAGRRPVLVVSSDEFNEASPGLVLIMPITSRERGYESHVELQSSTSGLNRTSYVLAEQIRSVSTLRLVHRIGYAERAAVDDVLMHLRLVLDL